MEIFQYQNSVPVWTSFENRTGEPGMGGQENFGAKGHPFEYFAAGEKKVLCDVDGPGVVRRVWFTLMDRSEEMLSQIYLCAYWDGEDSPSVEAPIGSFFCVGRGMKAFENEFLASPEGRSFLCHIPMPFKKHGKLVLENRSSMDNSHLFYDVNLTLEELPEDVLYFCTAYRSPAKNALGQDVEILPEIRGRGRFLGMYAGIEINGEYGGCWWGEGEVKIYRNGEKTPSLVGTGTEDYLGTAWGQGEFVNRWQGCLHLSKESASFYRFHGKDPIFFENGCKVELQAIGGAPKEEAKRLLEQGCPMVPVAYDRAGHMTHLYQKEWTWKDVPEDGFVTFYRQDTYSAVAYYYLQP